MEELTLGRIYISTPPVITSLLRLVPKADGELRRIYNLSHSLGESFKRHILPEYAALEYTTVNAILGHIRKASRGCILLKRDIKDAFRMIPLLMRSCRLMGFHWKGVIYKECCLSFGLCTVLFFFNLFIEALY